MTGSLFYLSCLRYLKFWINIHRKLDILDDTRNQIHSSTQTWKIKSTSRTRTIELKWYSRHADLVAVFILTVELYKRSLQTCSSWSSVANLKTTLPKFRLGRNSAEQNSLKIRLISTSIAQFCRTDGTAIVRLSTEAQYLHTKVRFRTTDTNSSVPQISRYSWIGSSNKETANYTTNIDFFFHLNTPKSAAGRGL
jgi:hypothetical protein